jgi:hypothetical protein
VTTISARTNIGIDISNGTATINNTYSLPTMTNAVVGGAKVFSNTTQTVAANAVTATAGRTYGVQKNSSGQLVVNVPWTDTPTDISGKQDKIKVGNAGVGDVTALAAGDGINITVDGKRKKSKFYESQLGEIITSIREKAAYMPFSDIAALIVSEIMMDPNDDDAITQDYMDFQSWAYDYETISDYLAAFATDKERFMQFYEADYPECPIPTDNGFLTLSTIHSAKGLEWDNVFIMGLEEGNFPNPYFCKGKTQAEVDEFFNGEWKKMYVASTRARESLVLSYATIITRKGFSFRKAPSRFINAQS